MATVKDAVDEIIRKDYARLMTFLLYEIGKDRNFNTLQLYFFMTGIADITKQNVLSILQISSSDSGKAKDQVADLKKGLLEHRGSTSAYHLNGTGMTLFKRQILNASSTLNTPGFGEFVAGNTPVKDTNLSSLISQDKTILKVAIKDEKIEEKNDANKLEEEPLGETWWHGVGLAIVHEPYKQTDGTEVTPGYITGLSQLDQVYLLAYQTHSPFQRKREDNMTLERTLTIEFFKQ